MVDSDLDSYRKKLDPAFRNVVQLPTTSSDKANLIGKRCAKCGQHSIGRKIVCPNCFSEEMEEKLLDREATLYSFSISQVAPWGFEAPLAVGLVDLAEGLRIWSQLDADETVLKIGMKMEMIIAPVRKDEDGNEVFGYKFRPIRETG